MLLLLHNNIFSIKYIFLAPSVDLAIRATVKAKPVGVSVDVTEIEETVKVAKEI